MSPRFLLTPEAEKDLLDIWTYIADRDSEKAADRVIARIEEKIGVYAASPGIGHHRRDLLDTRHRFFSVWKYVVAYQWKTRPIRVVAVVHGVRDLNSFFKSRPS